MPSILHSRGAKGLIPVSLLKGPAAAAELAGHGRPSLGLAQVPANPWLREHRQHRTLAW